MKLVWRHFTFNKIHLKLFFEVTEEHHFEFINEEINDMEDKILVQINSRHHIDYAD